MGYVVSPDWVIAIFLGGFLSCWLPASSAMSGLTLSMHLGYPSLIPGSGDGGGGGGFLSCGLPASSAMSGLTVSMHLVYLS